MKKIGLLTYFWAHNPGTFLQAYSTWQALRRYFPEDRVELVNYRHRRVFFRPGGRSLSPGKLWSSYRRHRLYERIKRAHLVLGPEELIDRDSTAAWSFIERQGYDMIVVGADTILEFLPFHRRENQIPVYWLPGDFPVRRVLCASSSGALSGERLTAEQRQWCRESLNGFALVGVRDEATRRLVGTLGLDNEDKLAMVPDPTFSFEVEANEAECLIRRKKLDFSRPTVALYLLKTFKPAAALARYYQRKGWQVVSLTPAPYGDFDLYDISPLEWASIYRHFSLVVTDRFHGTIFSLKNLTPVVAVVSDPGKITEEGLSKPYSLLKLFGMEETHFLNAIGLEALDEVTRLTEAASERFDRARVSQTLSGLGEEYHRFIERIGRI